MTNEATLQKMIEMKFSGMVQAFKNTLQSNFRPDMTADELVGYLVDAEWEERQNRRLARLVKNATFRVQAAIEQVYTHPVREIDKNLLFRLAD